MTLFRDCYMSENPFIVFQRVRHLRSLRPCTRVMIMFKVLLFFTSYTLSYFDGPSKFSISIITEYIVWFCTSRYGLWWQRHASAFPTHTDRKGQHTSIHDRSPKALTTNINQVTHRKSGQMDCHSGARCLHGMNPDAANRFLLNEPLPTQHILVSPLNPRLQDIRPSLLAFYTLPMAKGVGVQEMCCYIRGFLAK